MTTVLAAEARAPLDSAGAAAVVVTRQGIGKRQKRNRTAEDDGGLSSDKPLSKADSSSQSKLAQPVHCAEYGLHSITNFRCSTPRKATYKTAFDHGSPFFFNDSL